MGLLDKITAKLEDTIADLDFGIDIIKNHEALVDEAYRQGTADGYRDGYLDGVAETENKYAASEPEAESNPGDYEAKSAGPADTSGAVGSGESLSEMLRRIAVGRDWPNPSL